MSIERETETRRLYDAFRLARSYLPAYDELKDKEKRAFERSVMRTEADLGHMLLRRRWAHAATNTNPCGELRIRRSR